MTDEEEFAARSHLKWTREGDAWIFRISQNLREITNPKTSSTMKITKKM